VKVEQRPADRSVGPAIEDAHLDGGPFFNVWGGPFRAATGKSLADRHRPRGVRVYRAGSAARASAAPSPDVFPDVDGDECG
jgi:hypothetical protein